jgi:TetR/AcrR family transcriptional regulator, tetracycline repressor protein
MAREPAAAASKGPRLTQDRIVAAARDIARSDGIDAVSMRRLAEELDVWPMSVYRYFRDKDELLDAVVGSAAAEIEAPDPSRPWREQLTELATAIHTALEPGDVAARLPQAALSPGVLALSETGLSILTAAGFSADEAARAWHVLLGYASSRPPNAPARAARSALAGLDEDDYPALTGSA